jgi:ribonuclease BN (tRNA processing enzyme)
MDFINSWQIKYEINGYEFIGYSRGAFGTGLMCNPLKIFLDAGMRSQYEPNLILVTHGHSDHICEIYNILVGNCKSTVVPIITPPNITGMITTHINSHNSLSRGFPSKYTKSEIIGLKESHRLMIQGKLIEVEPFKMDHGVDTLGFGIIEIREKLKTEFIGREKELGELKKTMKITEEKPVPIFLFCGDTGNSILHTLPFEKYPIVIIESTFFAPEHVDEAKDRKHLHITDLEPYFIKNNNTHFILIHFSNRYEMSVLKNYQEIYEKKYNNIKFFL